jgi:DNA polymerase-3 subunit gamma/tau
VQAALGGAPFDLRYAVLEAMAEEDVAGALVGVHELLAQGHDVRRVADDLLRTLRDAFLAANAAGRVSYDGPADEEAKLASLAQRMGNALVVRGIEIFGQTIVDIRQQTVADPRLVLEVAVVRVARRESRTTVETLLERVERVEKQLASGGGGSAGNSGPAPAAAPPVPAPQASPEGSRGAVLSPRRSSKAARAPEPEASADASAVATLADAPEVEPAAAVAEESAPAASEPEAAPTSAPAAVGAASTFDPDDVIAAWPTVLEELKAPLKAVVQHAQPIGVEDGVVVFGVPRTRFEAINGRFRTEAETIKAAFSSQLGFQPRFVLRPHDFDAPGALRPVTDTDTDAAPATTAEADLRDEEPMIDLNDLVDAPDEMPPDSVARLVSDFGAQIVEERPRQ